MKSKKQLLQERLDSYKRNGTSLNMPEVDNSLLLLSKCNRECKYMKYVLPDNIVQNASYVDTLDYRCLNSPADLVSCLRKSNGMFNACLKLIDEGLLKTFPAKMFLHRFQKLVDDEVPDKLKNMTFEDFGIGEYGSGTIFMHTQSSNEVDDVAGQIAVLVPIYHENADKFNTWLNNNIKNLYAYGYMLASVEKLEHVLLPEVDLLVIQFEAKYSAMKFKLADVLLHVAPLKCLEKIKKNGLVPKAKSAEFKYDDRVYLFNQCKESLAVSYGKYKAKDMKDNGFCIFKIQKNNLENFKNYKNGKLRFYVDNAFETENGVQAIFTYSNVPLELLDDVCLVYDGPKFDKSRAVKFK